jgi:hypothetical protein
MVACWEGWTEGGLLHGNTRTPVLLHRSLALLLLVISDDGCCFFPPVFFFYCVRCLASGSLYAAKVDAPVDLS